MLKPGDLVYFFHFPDNEPHPEIVGVVTIDEPLDCPSGPSWRVFWLRPPTSTYDLCRNATHAGKQYYHERALRLMEVPK